MSPASPSYTLIEYNLSEGKVIPKIGEIIALRFQLAACPTCSV